MPDDRFDAARRRWPALDRAMRLHLRYGRVNGNLLAGGITYFGFLSFFPLLALAFTAAGYVSRLYPAAERDLVTAIEQVLPGIVSEAPSQGTVSLDEIRDSAATIGLIGLAGVLYAGLGWITALREGMTATFEHARMDKPGFIKGKLTDLGMLFGLGALLVASVAASSAIMGFADRITSAVGFTGPLARVLLWLSGLAIGVLASAALFMAMYSFLARSELPRAVLWRGSFLAASGFELLKLLAVFILAAASGSAFAPLALSITLLVWINYSCRLTIYAAAWCATAHRDER